MKISKADLLIYKALKRAVEEDKLRVYLDYAKINRPTSPVYNPWECLLPILAPILLGLVLIFFVGVIWGLVFMIIMILIYSGYFKKFAHKKLIERTKAYIVEDYEKCQELWDFGGVVFVNKDNKKLGCVSPDGDWKEFVVKNFSDYMTDKENNKEKVAKEEENKNERAPRASRRRRQDA